MSPGVKGMISRSFSPYDCVCLVHKSRGRNCMENRQGKTPAGHTSWSTAEAAFGQLGAAGHPAGLHHLPQLLPSSIGSLLRSVSFLVPCHRSPSTNGMSCSAELLCLLHFHRLSWSFLLWSQWCIAGDCSLGCNELVCV